ncbi:MAG TPA: immune inhibitor A domain-containing protein [Marmoricola sp.]
MARKNASRGRRTTAAAAAVVVSAAGLAAVGTGSATNAATAPALDATASESYINYVAPRAERAVGDDVRIDRRTGKVVTKRHGSDALAQAYAADRKHAKGNPVAARQLAKLEARAQRTGQSPQEIKSHFKGAKATQDAKLLTILVEFNDAANDDFTGTMVPETVFESRQCVPGTVQNGPLHNNIPNPADASHLDNNSMWVPDFSPAHFNKLLYTDTGLTERVRTDLTGPDGQPGYDISGYTMKNMYEEMSKGAYSVSGSATPWVTVPHSEGWYAANTCFKNADGQWEAGIPQSQNGHPDNPLGPGQLPIDAVAALAEAQPEFPWADYDIEDQGDVDGDGNVNEPDGVIDHVVLVHAGEDKSGGGGAQGVYSIWAHSSAVAGGASVPGTDLKLSNYIVQPEDSGVGVFAHEYGHDLGLPDLYDITASGESDIDFWDLMSSGSHSGPIFQSMPTHMGLWDKWVLGWADPVQVDPGQDPRDVIVGQTSRTPKGTADGVKVNLPTKVVTVATPHTGTNMWTGGNDQSWADVKLERTVDVPAASDAKFWMWNDYVIEEDWDFGFVEVSTDGGTTWSEQKVYDEAGNEVTTPDGYADPNKRMHDYGDKKYGLTGSSHGMRHDYVDLSSFAGQTVALRLRYATDAGLEERGWYADDFAVTGGGATTWSDDVDSGANGWTPVGGTFTNTTGAGWHKDTGTKAGAQYYLVEWRNYDGFDKGLQYAYDSSYAHDAWKVEKIRYNAPGALVWYRDTTYGNVNSVGATTFDLPSTGSKGGLLLVDSHFDPVRRTGVAADKDPSTLNNMPSRPQSSNAAFGLVPTKPFTECYEAADADGVITEPFSEYCTDVPALPAVSTFTDARGWYPGLELRGADLWFRDIDASVVVPSRDNASYSTRLVDPDGNLLEDLFGIDLGSNIVTGSGNPADDGVSFQTTFQVMEVKSGNTAAKIHIVPPTP